MWKIIRQIARTGIRSEAPPASADSLRVEAERIQREVLAILGRALAIRQVDAGSCNGCELEINALDNPYYNLEGLGIRFVASPRHADLLLVTGPVSRHMELALMRTYDATPAPKLVVAVGDCGCDGGIFGTSYATRGGVGERPRGGRRRAGLPARADRDPARHPHGGAPCSAGRGGVLGRPVLRPVIADRRRLGRHGLRYPRRRERGHAWDISTN